MISVKGMDTFNFEISFSKLKTETFSPSLVGTSLFSTLPLGVLDG